MATLRELKGRIGSVASSEKITGAMKMISSAKMHKAEGVLRRLTPFQNCVKTVIANLLSSDAVVTSPLTTARQTTKNISLVVFGSDDGLCGAYNVNIFKSLLDALQQFRQQYGSDVTFEILPVGNKMAKAIHRIASDPAITITIPEDVDSKSDGGLVKAFAEKLQADFLAGKTDLVVLQYMHYFSAGKQRPTTTGYLPVSQQELVADAQNKATGRPYLFEPDAHTIFATVLPMFLLSVMQEAFAENRASEQAARVMAMQSANDNAQKLLEQLQLEYNKLRQAAITTELLDIVGGQIRD